MLRWSSGRCNVTEGRAQEPPKRRSKWRRRAKISAIALVALCLLGYLVSCSINWICYARPPEFNGSPKVLSQQVQESDGVRRIGRAWLSKKDGILRMYLAGDPFTLGYSNAVLTQEYIEEQEASLIRLVKHYVPSALGRWLLKKYVLVRNRDLPSYVQRRYQLEIYGLSRGYRDPFPEIGPLYHRLLNYHAAHDISHAVMDNPLVGCTSFAAWGEATEGGHLLIGRNFDFDAGRCFDENKIVMRVEPDKGRGYISVGWPGLIGVVTGINDAKIAVSINAAQSTDNRRIGTPVSIVIRDVMQHASTLEEAITIIRRSQVFVTDGYLVADGKTGEAVIVEKTPLRAEVRRSTGNVLISANHFLSDALKDDPANVRYMADGTSVARYERMAELLAACKSPLNPHDVSVILRDRVVHGTTTPSLGHLAAINSLTATHSVIIDATAGLIWVSVYPHQLGGYVPFGLKDFEAPAGARQIGPDPLLSDGSYQHCQDARERVAKAAALLDDGDRDAAVPLLDEASRLNPGLYLPYLMLGELAFREARWTEAKSLLTKALSLHPAYRSERESVRKMLGQVKERLAGDGG